MRYVISGSFNPLHEQHLNIAHYIEGKFGTEVVFELCKSPYDKQLLSSEDIANRHKQFSMIGRQLVITNDSSFLEKAIGFRGLYKSEPISFLVGYDTVQRIDDKKYYFNSEQEKQRVLSKIGELNASFYVFPRNGKLRDGLSNQILRLCTFAESDFVESNISSSELRNGKMIDIIGRSFNKKWLESKLDILLMNQDIDIKQAFRFDPNKRLYTNSYTDVSITEKEFILSQEK